MATRSLLTGTGLALTGLDAVVTVAAVQFLGATELNPLLAGAIGIVGLHATMLMRLSLGVVVMLVLDTLTAHPRNRLGTLALAAAVVALFVVNLANGIEVGTYVLANGA